MGFGLLRRGHATDSERVLRNHANLIKTDMDAALMALDDLATKPTVALANYEYHLDQAEARIAEARRRARRIEGGR